MQEIQARASLKPSLTMSTRHGISRQITKKLKSQETIKYIEDLYVQGISLNLFDEDNEFRNWLFKILTSPGYEQLSIVLIVLSSIQLGMTTPLNDPAGSVVNALYWIDFFSTIVFTIECVAKIIAFGFIFNGQPSYLKNPWNLLDFVIIVLSIISLSPIANRL
jgi:Ion transport protein